MNHPAKGAACRVAEDDLMRGHRLYLIPDLSNWAPPNNSQTATSDSPGLVYLVPLDPPKVRSTPERRLHLRDTLAAGNASHNASILAKDPHFWDYLQQINLTAYEAEIDAHRARHFINRLCGVSGRHQLDQEPALAQRFFQLVQQPFLHWLLTLSRS